VLENGSSGEMAEPRREGRERKLIYYSINHSEKRLIGMAEPGVPLPGSTSTKFVANLGSYICQLPDEVRFNWLAVAELAQAYHGRL
jgi:hypothetical protein